MKEFLSLFKSSVEGTFDEFSSQFRHELKLLFGNSTRFEEIEDRQLEGICREVADPESISILERDDESGKNADLLMMPLHSGSGKIRFLVAEGSLRHVDVDQLHMLKWLYETRVDSDALMRSFRKNAVYDCDLGVLSKNVINSLFEMEKSRAEDFGTSISFLLFRLRQEQLAEGLDVIRRGMRRTDYLFGLEGSDVLLILVECSAYGTEAIQQRLKKLLGSKLIAAGYSIYPEQGETVKDLIAEAQGSLV